MSITETEIKDRAHGRLVTVPRKRPWTHKLWREGPRDQPNLWPNGHGRDAHATSESTSLPARIEIPPLVLIRTVADRQLVVAASDDVRALGIRPGMTLTEARALGPRVTHADHDPAADARGLEALARWMHRFTPVVALPQRDPKSEISNLKSQISDHHLFLDLTGCERVFDGLSNIVQMIAGALERMNLSVNLALAPTPGAAWALASYGTQLTIENCQFSIENLISSLSALPPAALRIDPETAHALHHLGIDTIAQLLALPRASLPSRFGPTLLTRLDQALGRAEEILLPLPHHIPIESSIEFDGAVESLEVLHIALRQLLRQIVPELLRRGCGARKIRAVFRRFYAPPIEKTVQLARPSRSVMNLFELLRCALEHVDMDAGFTGITIHVPVFERLTEQQIALLAQEECDAQAELDHLADRLVARLGDQALRQPKLLESHVPERRFTWHGFSTRDSSVVNSKTKTRVENPCHEEVRRPLELLAEPVEVQVMVSPSHDRDGRPILFRNGRDVHPLRHSVGPERISGEWWRNHHKTRDYFDVEDTTGKRFWLFRVNENRKWFLHGVFM